jgi:hypothetical protein
MPKGRWKLTILFHLFGGRTLRFSDLERAIPGVSQKVRAAAASVGARRHRDAHSPSWLPKRGFRSQRQTTRSADEVMETRGFCKEKTTMAATLIDV